MSGFEIHLLAGLITALLLYKYPLAAICVVVGSVFPDIDSKKSITHRLALLCLGVFSMIVFYPYGLVTSVLTTLLLVGFFVFLLPKHRGWMHKLQGQLLFTILCFLPTLDPVVAFAGLIGTTIHRIMDLV